jgi:predicted Zn-dependent protease
MAYLAQGKVEAAVKDLSMAAVDIPSVAKYYHLAQAEKRLGNVDAARTAMAKAQELQGEHNPFTAEERKGFEQLLKELN